MKEDIEKLKKLYQEQLEAKDREIEELRKENIILLKTALKKERERHG